MSDELSVAATVVSMAAAAGGSGVLSLTPFAQNLSWLATIVNIAMLSSPLQLVYRFVFNQMDPIDGGDLLTADAGGKQQPTLMMVNGVSIIPLLANTACCTGWVIYALITGLNAVLVGNGLGLVSALIGSIAYVYVYSTQLQHVRVQLGTLSPVAGIGAIPSSNNPVLRGYHTAVAGQKRMQTQLAIAATICVVLVWCYFELSAAALPIIRLFCGVSTICMFAAPVAVIRKVASGHAMPSAVFTWPNTVFTFCNCLLWLLFGLIISDAAVGLPNIVGIVVSLAQGSLLLRGDRKLTTAGVK